jgi:hypothetical protein
MFVTWAGGIEIFVANGRFDLTDNNVLSAVLSVSVPGISQVVYRCQFVRIISAPLFVFCK